MEINKNIFTRESGWLLSHFTEMDSQQTLLLFFAAPSYFDDDEIINLTNLFPSSIVMGCSTSGEIFKDGVYDESIVYVIIRFCSTSLKVSLEVDYHKQNIKTCGERVVNKLYNFELKHIFMLASGFNINIDEFISGLGINSGREISLSGGLAGDGEAFSRTWVYYKGFYENAIISLGMSGSQITVKQGCEGGWQKFGLERRITSSKGNILYEIDGLPALQQYKKYLGNLADKLPSSALLFPLAIRKNAQSSYVVRTILAVDESEQSITFAGDIPKGWLSSFMRCSNEGLLSGAKQAGMSAAQSLVDHSVSIMISCIGRRMVLGEACFMEIDTALSMMPNNRVVSIGFYSYGEISEKPKIDSKLHNQTMTITTISESMDEKFA